MASTIDGRDALGWEERIDTPTRGIPWVAYRVVVPYDTISYTIEVSTEDPLFKAGAPGSLRDIVSTFAIGETVYNVPLIAIAVGLLLFAAHIMRQRASAKKDRLRSINLVKIEKKEEGDGASEGQPTGAVSGTARPPEPPAEPTGGGGPDSAQ